MVQVASSLRRAAKPSRSRTSQAWRYRLRSCCCAGFGGGATGGRSCGATVARVRCKALLIEAVEPPSSVAASVAAQPSTSHSKSAARWRGGNCGMVATKASRTASRDVWRASGFGASSATRFEVCVRVRFKPRYVHCGAPTVVSTAAGPCWSGSRRRILLRLAIAFRQALVAIR